MGETESTRETVKADLDRKLQLSRPSRELLQELAMETAKQDNSPTATFQYAFALSKSSEKSELRYAISLLDDLVYKGYEHQIDCMYGAATALYLLGDYEEARSRCEAILRTDPKSRIAKELHLAAIASQEQKEKKKLKNAAMASAGVAAAVGLAAGIASLAFKK